MNTTYALFVRWMALKGFTSAREAAKALRVSPMGPSNWKNGHNAAPHIVERLAVDLGEDPATQLIAVFRETAKGKDVATLQRFAKRFGAAALLTVMVAGVSAPAPAEASDSIHYAQSNEAHGSRFAMGLSRRPASSPHIALASARSSP